MSRFRVTRRRLLFAIGGIIGLILIVPVCIYIGAGIALTISFSNGGFKFIPQDCNGVPIRIAGKVESPNHEPIKEATVIIKYVAIDNSKKFSYTVTTDKDGRFAYQKELWIFVCDDLNFDGSAKGFKSNNASYSLFSDHSENEISTTKVNKINITIALERSS